MTKGTARDMGQIPQPSNSHFKELLEFLSDWYWEQDENYRFTMLTGPGLEKAGINPQPLLGKARWDQGEIPLCKGGCWDTHKATLAARQPFEDFVYKTATAHGKPCYISVSGQPMFDQSGQFRGYRGIAKEVTKQIQFDMRRAVEHGVTRILANSDTTADAIRGIIRTVCETLGWSCGAYWKVDGPPYLISREESWGIETPAIEAFLHRGFDSPRSLTKGDCGLVHAALARGEPVWARDAAQDPMFQRTAEAAKAGLHGALAFPIKSGTSVIGVMEFFSNEIHEPDTDLLSGIAYIGGQVSQFIQLMQAREQLLQSEERFRNLTELSSDWLWEQDQQFRMTFLDGAFEEKTGLKAEMQLGKTEWALPALNMTAGDWAAHKARLSRREPFFDLEIRRPDLNEQPCWISISGRPVFDSNGRFIGYRGVGKDITARKLHEERIRYLATHDGLTALPNRSLFSEILNRTLQTSHRYSRRFVLLFIGLDRFKLINDTLGHEAGDMLLKEVGVRLVRCMRSSDVIARLGSDEFVVLAQEVDESTHAAMIADKILSAIVQPIVLLGQEIRTTASIGICMYPWGAEDAKSLIKNGDIAMHRAKEQGRNNYQFYSKDIRSESPGRLALESSLRSAVEREQFFLLYQPTLNLKSRNITGAEALVRWQHPQRGILSPLEFIPVAEETGLIVQLGRWVLNTACAQNVAWQHEGLPPVRIAVNLSARQFNDESLLDHIADALGRSGMDPKLLELELTESMVIQNPERARKLLISLKNMGVRLAVDDFGTGYSSLAQLKRFPIDTLKIDRSFIRDIPQNAEDKAITQAILAMARSLNLTVVAEGVETKAQETFLAGHGCDETQGFYFSKPVPPAEYSNLFREHTKKKIKIE
jgi:diguanylate cyclase (GGDEF)-like protein/PAS domain S-box-containing protein